LRYHKGSEGLHALTVPLHALTVPLSILVTRNCLSDSNNRATAEVNACIKKMGDKVSPSFKMGSSGSVLFNFEKKGRLLLTSAIDEDALIDIAINAGVDEADLEEPNVDKGDGDDVKAVVVTSPDDLGTLQGALGEAGIECAGSFVNSPLATVECSEEDMAMNLEAIDKLEDIDDVDSVEHNMLLA